MLDARGIQTIVGGIVAAILVAGLIGLLIYLDRRRVRTHPSQKKPRRFVVRGQIKREKKLANRKVRF